MTFSVKTSPFNPATYLETLEDLQIFLSEAFRTQDADHIVHCIAIALTTSAAEKALKASGLDTARFRSTFVSGQEPSLRDTLALLSALRLRLRAIALSADT